MHLNVLYHHNENKAIKAKDMAVASACYEES